MGNLSDAMARRKAGLHLGLMAGMVFGIVISENLTNRQNEKILKYQKLEVENKINQNIKDNDIPLDYVVRMTDGLKYDLEIKKDELLGVLKMTNHK